MSIIEIPNRFKNISQCYNKSEDTLSALSSALNDKYRGSKIALVVTGSLARKELTCGSDLDAYLISDCDGSDQEIGKELWSTALKVSGLNDPGDSGTFGGNTVIKLSEILNNIGGNNDDTAKITQRMLIVLESCGYGDTELYEKICRDIIIRYISDKITNHQLGMFLLNDIIRYYRTICVDFEYKTVEKKMPWGIRNIKLIYSRKLIYYSGLIMCAELAQKSAFKKREICLKLMNYTPIERLIFVLGEDIHKALDLYDNFLSTLSNQTARDDLAKVKSNSRASSELFTDLKNDGHQFSWFLKSAFERHYDSSHPIHKAILF